MQTTNRDTASTVTIDVDRAALLTSADRIGAAIISSPKLAAASRVALRTTWGWLNGEKVRPTTDAKLRAALGLPPRSPSPVTRPTAQRTAS
jgi:hypothetical protein